MSLRRKSISSPLELEGRMLLAAGLRSIPAVLANADNASRTSAFVSNPAQPMALIVQGRLRARPVGVEALIDQAFDDFRADYVAAQALFLTAPNNTTAGRTALDNAVTQRVNLLAQEITEIFLKAVSHQKKYRDAIAGIARFSQNRLTSDAPASLLGGLRTAYPPVGTAPSEAALYTLAANDAIDAAETATLNALAFTRNAMSPHKRG